MNFVQRGVKRKAVECGIAEKGDTEEDHSNVIQQYLKSERSVDPKTFLALPIEIQNELVSQWKAKQTNLPQTGNSRPKPKPKKKGTLDSFFAKK